MEKISPLKGALVVVAIAVAVVLYLMLAHVLGIPQFWAGFLWLFYWAGIEQMNFSVFPDSVRGAFTGLAVALCLHVFPQQIEHFGLAIALLLVVVLVYCSVMGWAKPFVNNATMLFLTVGTIPTIQAHGDFAQIFSALMLGVVFFGGLLGLGTMIGKRRARA